MILGYIILALGLVLIIEGLVYALAPSLIEDLLAAIRALSLEQRRIVGFVALISGVLLVWIAMALGVRA